MPEDHGSNNIPRTGSFQDKQTNAELAKIMGEFGEMGEPVSSSSSKGDDLLAMMDGL